MKEIALILLAWLGDSSAYDTADIPLPEIIEMSPSELTAEAYSDDPHLMPATGVDDRILGLYNFEAGDHGTIYVLSASYTDDGAAPDPPAWTDPIFQERLLHELVHHVQHVSGAYSAFACRNFGERDAYALGGRFLKDNHARDPLLNRNFWAHLYSRC